MGMTVRGVRQMVHILSFHTGKTVEEIENDADRDNYMPADVAAEYGLIDKVLTKTDDK